MSPYSLSQWKMCRWDKMMKLSLCRELVLTRTKTSLATLPESTFLQCGHVDYLRAKWPTQIRQPTPSQQQIIKLRAFASLISGPKPRPIKFCSNSKMLRCGSQGLSVTVRKFASGNQLSTSLHSAGAALATMMTQLMGIPTFTRDSIPSVLREDVDAILDSLSPHQIISVVDLCLVNCV